MSGTNVRPIGCDIAMGERVRPTSRGDTARTLLTSTRDPQQDRDRLSAVATDVRACLAGTLCCIVVCQLLSAGSVLAAAEVSLLTSQGINEVTVHRRPVVGSDATHMSHSTAAPLCCAELARRGPATRTLSDQSEIERSERSAA